LAARKNLPRWGSPQPCGTDCASAPKYQAFGGEGAGGLDGSGEFVAQGVKAGGGERLLLAADALHFADPGVGVQIGQGEELVAGLFDAVFHAQPVEQRALGLLLVGVEFD